MSRIVSSLPGRIRIRDRMLRNQARIEQLEATLIRIPDIISIKSNAKAGSIVLHFDGARTDMATLEAELEKIVDDALASPLPLNKKRRSVNMQVNRYAKTSMLSSLAPSLALAATGQKPWHTVLSRVFVAYVGAHLTAHR